jgi:hypothetical protein
VIDGNGILWSSDWSNNRIGRYDTNAADPASAFLGAVATGGPSYGLAVDNGGNIWNSHYDNGTVTKLDSAGNIIGTYSLGLGSFSKSRGVAVTPDNNIWVASSARDTVTRLDNNGNVLAQIAVGDLRTDCVSETDAEADKSGSGSRPTSETFCPTVARVSRSFHLPAPFNDAKTQNSCCTRCWERPRCIAMPLLATVGFFGNHCNQQRVAHSR